MTDTPALTLAPSPDAVAPRPGSRADRMSHPRATDALRLLAEHHGVCVRPLALRRTDTTTGQTEIVEVPCGATLASKCKPCAERGRRLRIQQIREGWHLDHEPAITPHRPGDDVMELVRLRAHLEFERNESERGSRWDEVRDLDDTITDVRTAIAETGLRGHLTPPDREPEARKARSTKRRQDTRTCPGSRRAPASSSAAANHGEAPRALWMPLLHFWLLGDIMSFHVTPPTEQTTA